MRRQTSSAQRLALALPVHLVNNANRRLFSHASVLFFTDFMDRQTAC